MAGAEGIPRRAVAPGAGVLGAAEAGRPGGAPDPFRRGQAVLVVDDEPDILESLRDVLEAADEHLRVLAVGDPREALEVLRRESVSLILSDYKMPGMDGLTFLAAARKLRPGTPRVLITAFPDLDVAIRAINEAGIDFFVTKPFNPGTVIDVVRSLLAEQRAREQRAQSFERARALVERVASAGPGGGP